MEDQYKRAAEIIINSKNCISLTGAGISTESGIPDFRSAGGLWEKYDPMKYAHINSFRRDPEEVWGMFFDLTDLTRNAKPNPAHISLAKLEEMGILKGVVTQNIDNLHQEAGCKNVIEFHGNANYLECLDCKSRYDSKEFKVDRIIPRCLNCGAILKPSVVFFGEMIPQDALWRSEHLAISADSVLVIGTSAVVYPASGIPYTAKANGATIIEMNLERTSLTSSITDIFIEGFVGSTLPVLFSHIKGL